MKAVQIASAGRAIVVDIPAPVARDGEVLVRVAAASICGTDHKLARSGGVTRRTLGHEIAGYLSDGSLVGVHPDTGCGTCAWCRVGMSNRCPFKESVGIDRDGGLAGMVAVPANHAVPIVGVPLAVAPLLEPLACCVAASRRVPSFNGPVLIVGAGAMGILLMWVLQAAGHTVAICQSSEPRRQQAAALGADYTMAPSEQATELLGQDPAAVFVTAPGSEPLAWALERVAEGGSVHAFAGTPGGAMIDANLVHYRHLALVGGTGSGLADYTSARDLVASGRVDPSQLPIRRTDLIGAAATLSGEQDRAVLRTMVDISDPDR